MAKRIFFGIILLVPVASILFLLNILIQHDQKYIDNGKKVTGTVVDVRYENRAQRPIIEYMADNGTQYYYDKNDLSIFEIYEKGDRVELSYLLSEPNNSILAENKGFDLIRFILGWFALVFLLASLGMFLGERFMKKVKFGAIFLLGFGVAFSSVGFVIYQEHHHFMKNAEKATGTIIDKQHKICESENDDGNKREYDCYSYSVHFLNKTNKRTTWQTGYGSREKEIGEKVKLLYRKNEPTNARYDSFMEGYGAAMIAGFFGMVALLGAAASFRKR